MANLWNPVKPHTVTLSVECEEHDVRAVIEAMQSDAVKLRFFNQGNIGPVTIKSVEGRNTD